MSTNGLKGIKTSANMILFAKIKIKKAVKYDKIVSIFIYLIKPS